MIKYYHVNALNPDGEFDWIVTARNSQEAVSRVKKFLPEAQITARPVSRAYALSQLGGGQLDTIFSACVYS